MCSYFFVFYYWMCRSTRSSSWSIGIIGCISTFCCSQSSNLFLMFVDLVLFSIFQMSFPNILRVVYSTCSIHEEENENVVRKVIFVVWFAVFVSFFCRFCR